METQSERTDYLSYYDVDDDYDPEIDPADFTSVVDNPYLSFIPGTVWRYEGVNEDGEAKEIEITVTSESKTVMGIEMVVVQDRVWEKGELVEDTVDWYAQDTEGNVWYFGEVVSNYDEGELKDNAGSWEAGVNGAKPGIMMLADPQVGVSYRQEYLVGEAEDLVKVESITETVETGLGTYTNCVRTKDFNPFEPNILEDKYYCKENGGLAYEIKVAGEEGEIKLVSYTPAP